MINTSFILGALLGASVFFVVAGITAFITQKKVKEQESKEHQDILEVITDEATEKTEEN